MILLNNCPYCGSNPEVVGDHLSLVSGVPTRYLVKCPKCEARSFSYDTEDMAAVAWNNGRFTRDTKIKNLPMDDPNIDGIIRLAETVMEDVSDTYMALVKKYEHHPTGKNRSLVRKMEAFFYASPFMVTISAEPEVIIKSLRKKAVGKIVLRPVLDYKEKENGKIKRHRKRS